MSSFSSHTFHRWHCYIKKLLHITPWHCTFFSRADHLYNENPSFVPCLLLYTVGTPKDGGGRHREQRCATGKTENLNISDQKPLCGGRLQVLANIFIAFRKPHYNSQNEWKMTEAHPLRNNFQFNRPLTTNVSFHKQATSHCTVTSVGRDSFILRTSISVYNHCWPAVLLTWSVWLLISARFTN